MARKIHVQCYLRIPPMACRQGCGCAYLQHDAILDEKPVQFIMQLAQLHQTLESPVVLALPELV